MTLRGASDSAVSVHDLWREASRAHTALCGCMRLQVLGHRDARRGGESDVAGDAPVPASRAHHIHSWSGGGESASMGLRVNKS